MGKVFTPEEIQVGKIPVEGAHLAAADIIIDQLLYGDAFEKSPNIPNPYMGFTGINSGLIHGSVAHGTENVRSDLDVLLIHKADAELFDTLGVVRDVFGRITENLHVPIEANIIELNDAHHKNHRIDPLFLRYLEHAQDDEYFSVNFPVSNLGWGFAGQTSTPRSLLRVVQRFTGAKTASFAGALTQETPMDEHRYQRALELPKNLGRKVIAMTDPDFIPSKVGGNEIIERFRTFAFLNTNPEWLDDPRNLFRSNLYELAALDREYTDVLNAAINGEVSIQAYRDWLDGNKLQAFTLAHRICVTTQHILRMYGESLSQPQTNSSDKGWIATYADSEPMQEFAPGEDEPDSDDYESYMALMESEGYDQDDFESDY